MSFTFPTVDKKKPGYSIEQVDQFLANARVQFTNPGQTSVTAHDVRNTEFDLVHGGYVPEIIDGAMDKLEDSFASREIQRQKADKGSYALDDRLARVIELIRGRLERPKGKRFASNGFLLRGYSRKQVDALCEHVMRHLDSSAPLSIDDVRRIVFNAKRGGYVEAQVDAFIDRVIEALQIEQNR
ncbi:MAG: DivIVA domain-containing protein [Rhodoluna sp.]